MFSMGEARQGRVNSLGLMISAGSGLQGGRGGPWLSASGPGVVQDRGNTGWGWES